MKTKEELKKADEWFEHTFSQAFSEAKEIGLWGAERLAYVVNRTQAAYKATQQTRSLR